MNDTPRPYRGRFAPSPTGDLHFGSLVAAVASYLDARRHGGRWLIRVEDIDPPREVPGSAARIIDDLARFGMESDEPVLYQNSRLEAYQAAVSELLERGLAFRCGCSRSDLPASGVYPGTCRNGIAPGGRPRSIRLAVGASTIRFRDAVQGDVGERLDESTGDFVIHRADGLSAYQLAVVVDDAFQGISHVVRGADLLDSTARQIFLQHCLGFGTPAYAHIPLAMGGAGAKLSKRLVSDPVGRRPPAEALTLALRFLGHDPPQGARLNELWEWAVEQWDLGRVPRLRESAHTFQTRR